MKHTPAPWKVEEKQWEDWRINISSGFSNIAAAYHMNDDPINANEEKVASW